MTAAPKNYLKEPKQNRSKASLERLLNAACELLTENGYKDFTLQEVSKRAKVSIGSIYNRFKSKEDLIRLLQVRELEGENKMLRDEIKSVRGYLQEKEPIMREMQGWLNN